MVSNDLIGWVNELLVNIPTTKTISKFLIFSSSKSYRFLLRKAKPPRPKSKSVVGSGCLFVNKIT